VSKRKSATEKLESARPPELVELDAVQQARWGGKTMVISTPRDIREAIRVIPEGHVATLTDLRAHLAKVHGACVACPLTTGIFLNIVAAAAEETGDVVPWWRVVRANGELNPKFPGGETVQAARLEAEGHSIDRKRKLPRVGVDRAFAWG
jgi:alkylated DNA nucleotide flippase Atl1